MPRPAKALPMAQNWDCHGCGDCCRTYAVRVTTSERERIEAQDWSDVPELANITRVVYEKRPPPLMRPAPPVPPVTKK